jgi:hypothetical protein
MDAGVDREGRGIHRLAALDHLSVMADPDQVRGLDQTEVQSERIDPERVGEFRIARGDMTDDTLVEAEFGKQAKARREPLLAMQPLLGHAREHRRRGKAGIHLVRRARLAGRRCA